MAESKQRKQNDRGLQGEGSRNLLEEIFILVDKADEVINLACHLASKDRKYAKLQNQLSRIWYSLPDKRDFVLDSSEIVPKVEV